MSKSQTPLSKVIRELAKARNLNLSKLADKAYLEPQLMFMILRGECNPPQYFVQLLAGCLRLSSKEKRDLANAVEQTPVSETPYSKQAEKTALDVCIKKLLEFDGIISDQAKFIKTICDENEDLRAKMPRREKE